MTSQKTGSSSFSFLSLALLEDSGWYKVNYKYSENYHWGKDNGCAFFESDCSPLFKEFCITTKSNNCSYDHKSKLQCSSSSFSDRCHLNEYIEEFRCQNTIDFSITVIDEEPGPYSRCFEVNSKDVDSAGCFKSKCIGNELVFSLGN